MAEVKKSLFSEGQKDAFYVIIALLFAFLVLRGLNLTLGVNEVKGASSVNYSATPSETPTVDPSPAAQVVQQAPAQYQNYGWYMHDGKSEQYVDGQWYTSPQQGSTTTQPSQQAQSNNPTVTCHLSYETAQMDYASCAYLQRYDPGNNTYPTLQPIPQMPTEQPTPVLYAPTVQGATPLPTSSQPLPPCTQYAVAMGYPCQP